MKSSTKVELLGIPCIALLGVVLHYAYETSGNALWVAVFAAVDESIWEHLKLAFWPAVLWSALTGAFVCRQAKNFWIGKLVSITFMPLFIALGFYGYTALLGHHALVWDILLFVIAIAIGQLSAIIIFSLPAMSLPAERVALVLLLLELLAFGTLTFAEVDLPIFVEQGN